MTERDLEMGLVLVREAEARGISIADLMRWVLHQVFASGVHPAKVRARLAATRSRAPG